MQERRIALVGAMPMEVEPYLTRIGDARREECGPFAFHLGTACGVPVAVLCCGIGKVNAAMAVQALIGRLAPGLVLHSGVGGSLTAGLGLLDALIARDCVQYDVDTTALGDPPGMISTIDRVSLPCDAAVADGLMAAAREAGASAKFGRVATGDRFLSAAEEKRGIAEAVSYTHLDVYKRQVQLRLGDAHGFHQALLPGQEAVGFLADLLQPAANQAVADVHVHIDVQQLSLIHI